MDLGIEGRTALVSGASKGLGQACALALAQEGVAVTLVARNEVALQAAAQQIRHATGVRVAVVAADITTAAGQASALAACPHPDILVTNAGGPKPGDFRDWAREDWLAALDANMLTPIALIKATVDGMMARGFGRIVNITSAAVKAPIDILGLSNGARSGLTGFVAGLARSTVARNVTINNLLPGPFATDRLSATLDAAAHMSGRSHAAVQAEWLARNPAGRFGSAEEFGKTCAYLCSVHAGYLNGQNVLLDGGAYPGVF
ncbi:MAG TPA: SDR family oxidoreductase [Pseudorhodoferax sp.]|nr:SDR family oxidoreductase [Pseudorhodoferax sp.]